MPADFNSVTEATLGRLQKFDHSIHFGIVFTSFGRTALDSTLQKGAIYPGARRNRRVHEVCAHSTREIRKASSGSQDPRTPGPQVFAKSVADATGVDGCYGNACVTSLRDIHRDFLATYGLSAAQVPLVRYEIGVGFHAA